MKHLAFLALLAIAAVLSSCGSNTEQKLPTNANWQAQLTGGTGLAADLNFLVNFNESATINDFSFIKANNPCFPVTAVFAAVNLTNNLNISQVTGSIVLTVRSETGNVLTLSAVPPAGKLIATSNNGVLTNGAVNGSWWLTPGSSSSDTGCVAGSATSPLPFTMCQNATGCTMVSELSVSEHQL